MTKMVIDRDLLCLVLNMLDRDSEKGQVVRGEAAADIRKNMMTVEAYNAKTVPLCYILRENLPVLGDHSIEAIRIRRLYKIQTEDEIATQALQVFYTNWDKRVASSVLIQDLLTSSDTQLAALEKRYDMIREPTSPRSKLITHIKDLHSSLTITKMADDRRFLQNLGREVL